MAESSPDQREAAILVSGSGDESLEKLVQAAGFRTIQDTDGEGQASIAIADFRPDFDGMLASLARFREANPGSVTLALVPKGARERVSEAIEAGATHYFIGDPENSDVANLLLAARNVAELAKGTDGQGSDRRRRARSRLEIDLRPALENDEIGILYQPQARIDTGAIIGVEALARWQHPDLGDLGAVTLFAAAEQSQFTPELSRHVQSKAMADASSWKGKLAGLSLSLNVTASELDSDDFVDDFCDRVAKTGMAPERLAVELIETQLVRRFEDAAEKLSALRSHGFRIAIDDFGTGYSSLAYLKNLPVDCLKIDRRLTQDIAGSERDRVVVRSVIDLGKSLGLAVIAEGVETEEQRDRLASDGCELYQGFLCSPPLSLPSLRAFVDRNG